MQPNNPITTPPAALFIKFAAKSSCNVLKFSSLPIKKNAVSRNIHISSVPMAIILKSFINMSLSWA